MDVVPMTAPDILTPEIKRDMEKFLMDTTERIYTQISEGRLTMASLSTASEIPVSGQFGKS